MKRFDFLQSFIVVAMIALAAVAIAFGVRPSFIISSPGTIVGKVSDKWTGYRIWTVDSFARVATDHGTVTVAIGDQYNQVHPGFRYEIEIREGRAIAAKRLPD
jgi:hypothetical protein